jgi:hypothetical protein
MLKIVPATLVAMISIEVRVPISIAALMEKFRGGFDMHIYEPFEPQA